MANDTDIIVRIKAEGAEQFVRELKKAGVEVANVGDEVDKTEKRTSSAFKNIGKGLVAAFSVGVLIEFVKGLSRVAVQLDATEKKFSQVFGSATKIVEDFAKANARAVGLTTAEYKRAAAAAGDLLIPLGFQRKEAAKLSSQLVNLSGALSAWTGGQLDAKQTADILTKALLGEREQLKTLGINIQEADVQQRLLEKGQKKLTGTTLAQAKATATLELIYEKSADAQAAFADDTTTLAEAQLELRSGIGELRDALAESLIPALTDLISFLNDAVNAYNRFADRISGRKALNEFEESIQTLDDYALKVERLGLVLKRNELESENVLGSSKFIFEINKQIEVIDSLLAQRKAQSESTDVIIEKQEEEIKTIKNVKQAYEELAQTAETQNARLARIVLENIPLELQTDAVKAIGKRLDFEAEQRRKAYADDVEAKRAAEEAKTEAERQAAEERQQILLEQEQARRETSLDTARQSFNVASDLLNAEQAIIQNRFDRGIISEKEYQEQRAKLQEKQAKANKANAIFEIGINTATAITSAFKAGPIIGPILAGVISGLAAAQLAAVLKTPIPKFAKGTPLVGDGFELGTDRTLAWLNKGERVVTADTNRKHFSLFNAIEDNDVPGIMKALADSGIPVQFDTDNTLVNKLDVPYKTLKEIVKDRKKSKVDLNPLLNASDRQRVTLGRKLDKVNHNLERLNQGIHRRMTKA